MSPKGSDSNDGSFLSPVATIEQARDIIRTMRVSGKCDDSPVSIVLREGEYRTDGLKFGLVDSGTENFPLTIKNYEGEKVRITGGVDIAADKLSKASAAVTSKIIDENAREHIMSVNLYENGVSDLGKISRRGHQVSENLIAQAQVSVDAKDMKLAGWPNDGFVGMQSVVSKGYRKNPKDGDDGKNILAGCSFTYSGYDRPALWANPDKAWISGSLGPNFAYDYYPVKSVSGNTVTLKEGAIVDYYSKHYFRYENVLEELDTPGEYYIDRDNGMLYIYMPENADENSKITVSETTKDLISITNAKNIKIEGIEIDSGRAGGITVSGTSSQIVIDGCKIHSFGANGVALGKSTFSTVKNSKIYDIGKSAVTVGGGDYAKLISSGNRIANNDIYRFSQLERSYTTGVYITYQGVGVQVLNNHIHDAPHAGIIFYGVNNRIAYNEIDNVVKEFHDMDAIYVNNYDMPWERGNVIEHNSIHDLGKETFVANEKQMNVAAIRTDNNGHGLTIRYNLFYNIGRNSTNAVSAIHAQGSENKIYKNTFVDCSESYMGPLIKAASEDRPQKTTAAIYAKYSNYETIKSRFQTYLSVYQRAFPELAGFWEENFYNNETNSFNNNLIVNIKIPLSKINDNAEIAVQNTDSQGYRATRGTVSASGNVVTSDDVGFMDYSGGNYELGKTSEYYTTNYINTNAMGLQ